MFDIHFFNIIRLGESSTTKDALLLSERQEKDELKKALTETEYKNEELTIKIGETNKKIEHLQNTIHMYVPLIKFMWYKCIILVFHCWDLPVSVSLFSSRCNRVTRLLLPPDPTCALHLGRRYRCP